MLITGYWLLFQARGQDALEERSEQRGRCEAAGSMTDRRMDNSRWGDGVAPRGGAGGPAARRLAAAAAAAPVAAAAAVVGHAAPARRPSHGQFQMQTKVFLSRSLSKLCLIRFRYNIICTSLNPQKKFQ